MAHEVVIYAAAVTQNLDGYTTQASSQDLLDIGTDQETLVLAQIEGISIVGDVTAGTQNALARACRIAVVVS